MAYALSPGARRRSMFPPRREAGPEDLNVVPFLDVVMNLVLFLLATLATTFTASIPLRPPGPAPLTTVDPVVLAVVATREGYVVGARGGYFAPGCERLGPVATAVPLRDGAHDPDGLRACLLRARAHPDLRDGLARQRAVDVSVFDALPYGTLVETLDAARESRPGANDLFTEPRLGIMR